MYIFSNSYKIHIGFISDILIIDTVLHLDLEKCQFKLIY